MNIMHHFSRLCLGLALLAPGLLAAQSPYRLPVLSLKAGDQSIQAEVASTEAQRSRGLMHRNSMPEQHGMLFVFEKPARYCFWMKNTLIPLSIAFLDADGTIVNLADMEPQSESHHCAAQPVGMALEMNQGWFEKHGMTVGKRIEGLESVSTGEGDEASAGSKP